jgi:UTP--glucose-1-phosphate uridylyltransferase
LWDDLPGPGATNFTRQHSPIGLSHSGWCARELVGDAPFALLLPDVLVQAKRSCLGQMIDAQKQLGEKSNIVAVEEVPMERVHMYGVVGIGKERGKAFEITGMVEKPKREDAPSNLIISGRYILQPQIFAKIAMQDPGAGGEIQLTDAMIKLMAEDRFFGLQFEGRTYDCGDKIGFLAANVAYALEREDIGPAFRETLKEILKVNGGL